MTASPEAVTPVGEMQWSRRAIINAVGALENHAGSLTLVGGHAVLLRTMDVAAPMAATGDGDLGITPSLVADAPSIEKLLLAASYEYRHSSRPGLWGRTPFVDRDGRRQYRERIDLLAGRAISGAVGKNRRGVPALRVAHGSMSVANTPGLELSAFDRSRLTVPDLADQNLSVEVHVAGVAALVCAKAYKIGERLEDAARDRLRDKDVGDLWRLMASTPPDAIADTFSRYADHDTIGASVRLGSRWLTGLLRDLSVRERARRAYGNLVDPRQVDDVFDVWHATWGASPAG